MAAALTRVSKPPEKVLGCKLERDHRHNEYHARHFKVYYHFHLLTDYRMTRSRSVVSTVLIRLRVRNALTATFARAQLTFSNFPKQQPTSPRRSTTSLTCQSPGSTCMRSLSDGACLPMPRCTGIPGCSTQGDALIRAKVPAKGQQQPRQSGSRGVTHRNGLASTSFLLHVPCVSAGHPRLAAFRTSCRVACAGHRLRTSCRSSA